MKTDRLSCFIAAVGVAVASFLRPETGMAAAGFPYSTHIEAGNDDWASSVAVGPQGEIFVTGYTLSSNFPGVGAISPNGADVLVMRLDPSGKQTRFSVLIGGASDDRGLSIAVNGSNQVVVAVQSGSADFPTKNAAIGTRPANADNALFKLSPTGALQMSTYIGGGLDDVAHELAIGVNGLIVTGYTESANFPSTGNALQLANALKTDLFLTRVGSGAEPVPTPSRTPTPALTKKVYVPLTSR